MNSSHYDKITLTSYFNEDLDARLMEEIQKHLLQCESCAKVLLSLREEQKEFLKKMPFEQLPERVDKGNNRTSLWRTYYALAASLLLAIGGLYLFRMEQKPSFAQVKGGSSIALYKKGEEGIVEKQTHHVYTPGEQIQITYSSVSNKYLILLSIDETGKISSYYPQHADSSVLIETGADIPLPNSIVLDGYIGQELFIALFSSKPKYVPLLISKIKSKVVKQGSLEQIDIPHLNDEDVHTILITKVNKEK